MRQRHSIRRLVVIVLGGAVLLGATAIGILIHPEPLYAYQAESRRLRLYSDRPFAIDQGRAVLVDVERRLAAAPGGLRDPNSVYRIFVTNGDWRRRVVLLWNYGAGGVNYFPIAGTVFLRQSDIDADRVLRGDGGVVAPPRTLAYFAAHEIGHSLIGRRTGAVANWRLPVWLREGIADYVAFSGKVDIAALTRSLRANDPDLDPERSGLYARYRLLVAYMLDVEGWSVDRLLTSKMTQREAEERLLERVPPQ
jgi:hypothetical protein